MSNRIPLWRKILKYFIFVILVVGIYFVWKDIYYEVFIDFVNFVKPNVAIILSIVALLVTAYESFRKRKHDRLSVKPLLSLYAHTVGNEPLVIHLDNDGIGPAVIKKADYYFDNKIKIVEQGLPFEAILKELGIISEKYNPIFQMGNWPSITIAAKDFLLILEIKNKLSFTDVVHLRTALKRVRLRIEYSSIYDEEVFIFDGSLCDY